MGHQLRHSLRRMRHRPGLVLAAVSTLGLSIGIATAVFSVVDTVLLRPLPITRPDQVVVIWPRERANPDSIGEISHAVFRTWRDENRSFQEMAAIGSVNWSLILREGEATTVPVAGVSASFFRLMGTAPLLGRALQPEDDARGSASAAVISHRAWTTRFGADPAIVGRGLRFHDSTYTIVGVMPEDFDYPRGVDFWIPVVPNLAAGDAKWGVNSLEDRYWGVLHLLGRLRPGVSLSAARDEMSGLIGREPAGSFRPGSEAVLTPLADHIFGGTRTALMALAISVGLVLMIGCANVTVLLLIRTDVNAQETATRLAIGASRRSIVLQSLTDAALLTVAGAAAGVTLAYWSLAALIAIAPADVPRLDAIRIDLRALLFAVSICAAAAVFIGLVPGLQASRLNLAQVAGSGTRATRPGRLRRTFVVAQAGLALVLLVCAGLVGRSFANLLRIDIGFQPANVLTLNATIPDAPPPRVNALHSALLERVRALPGVQAAGAVSQRPLELRGIGTDAPILIEGQRQDPQFMDWQRNPSVNLEIATSGYFEAIGTRIVRGRPFIDGDDARAPLVVVISEGLARRLWPGEDPIGKRIFAPGSIGTGLEQAVQRPSTVVGIAQDARYRGLLDPRFDLYIPYLQSDLDVKHLMVRIAGDYAPVADAIRAAALEIEPAALVDNVTTMDTIVNRTMAPWRFSASTLVLLGVLALGLASLGLYAAISQSVAERTREIGVRMALGAVPREVARLVLLEGLRLTGAGLVLGLIVAIGVSRELSGLLYGLRPADPLTLAAMAALLTMIAAVALLMPAWRATRLDPVTALRRM